MVTTTAIGPSTSRTSTALRLDAIWSTARISTDHWLTSYIRSVPLSHLVISWTFSLEISFTCHSTSNRWYCRWLSASLISLGMRSIWMESEQHSTSVWGSKNIFHGMDMLYKQNQLYKRRIIGGSIFGNLFSCAKKLATTATKTALKNAN